MTEQAVVTTDEESTISSEGTNAQDGLDSLLSEFESETAVETKTASGEQTDDVAKRLEALETERANERYDSEMKSLAGTIRGDSENSLLTDKFIKRWLESEAADDPRIATAWANRNREPEKFNKVIKELGKQLHGEVGKMPDQNLTENRNSLEAAVRASSTSTQQSSEVNWASLDDNEFQKEKMKLLRSG